MKNVMLALSLLIILFTACKKDVEMPSYSSLNVVNTAIGSGAVKINYFGKTINWSTLTGTIGSLQFGSSQTVTLFNSISEYPLIIVPSLDTLNAIYKQTIAFETKSVYTLFTIGQLGFYDGILIKENDLLYKSTDSVIAIRFINLSPNSPPVNITLGNTPAVNETSNLVYKAKTEFKNYVLKSVIPVGSTTFQVRDAITNAILATYTLPTSAVSPYTTVSTSLSRFKSITIAIKGLAGVTTGVNAYSLFPIPHY